eukprot:TRINITY_DN676_c2_g1_i3.p1 TRINITY_DN676_c2_g1~~TRINITY_DN676_c2_g1_i3.p1  ORF type:complete len:102 (+),score=13.18 TRINITY_DN676_c2_g1_i3:1154-1459(+)
MSNNQGSIVGWVDCDFFPQESMIFAVENPYHIFIIGWMCYNYVPLVGSSVFYIWSSPPNHIIQASQMDWILHLLKITVGPTHQMMEKWWSYLTFRIMVGIS